MSGNMVSTSDRCMADIDSDDFIEEIHIDKELANETFPYILKSGDEGMLPIEQFLKYNEG